MLNEARNGVVPRDPDKRAGVHRQREKCVTYFRAAVSWAADKHPDESGLNVDVDRWWERSTAGEPRPEEMAEITAGQAARSFPSVYRIALPALRAARTLAPHDKEAVRVQTYMALIADVADTNLLHRGRADGLRFAHASASALFTVGGVGRTGWREHADGIHQAFVARNLSPGGSADLLAMALLFEALFVDRLDP
ncbi:triphosphoribosyl-dephospho-CoA synthase [Bradyrhizobium sp. Cp5.3]|uniref:triphosphoribosyl-dephospho-CoA synthase n=1 Tax=Bradyrhizobium sp. Cp5.3 TaxID=443598 RepID=UPI0004275DEF